MKRISTILWTNKEPEDKNILWLNKRKLYLWDNGWVDISGSGGSDADLSNYLTKQKADKLYQPKGNYASQSSVNSLQDTTEFLDIELGKLLDDIKTKQDKLTAGQGINIIGNTISCTLDTNLYVVVNELPVVGVHNKIYLVKDDRAIGSNVYTEYIYNNDWEILGEYQASVDLKPYALKTEIPTRVGQLENDAEYVKINELPEAETYVLKFTISDGVNTGAYNAADYANLLAAIKAGKLIIISGGATRVTADSQAIATGDAYVVIRYSTPRISEDNKSVTISFYELKFSATEYTSKAIHKTIE